VRCSSALAHMVSRIVLSVDVHITTPAPLQLHIQPLADTAHY